MTIARIIDPGIADHRRACRDRVERSGSGGQRRPSRRRRTVSKPGLLVVPARQRDAQSPRRPADLLPLNFGVTYWDRLGWKDKFAHRPLPSGNGSMRGRASRGNVATPQFIINGQGVVTGSDARQLARTIRDEERPDRGPAITVDGKRVRIAAGRAGCASDGVAGALRSARPQRQHRPRRE